MRKLLLLLSFFIFLLVGCNKTDTSMGLKGSGIVSTDKLESESSPSVPLVPVDMNIFNKNFKESESSNATLLEDSVDLSLTTVNYYNNSDGDIGDKQLFDDGKPLTIVDYGPVGKLPEEIQKPSIYLLFSKPMVPLTKLGEPLINYDKLTINPPLDGVFRWYGTNLLSFETTKPILQDSDSYSKEYKVTVKKSIESLSGGTLDSDFNFTFYPNEVEMVNLIIPTNETEVLNRTDNVPFNLAYRSIVRFNMPVDINYIEKGLEVSVNKKIVNFSVSRSNEGGNRGGRSVVIDIPKSTKFFNNSVVEIKLKKGAVPRMGTPEKAEEQSLFYETLNQFNLVDISSYSYSTPTLPKGNRFPVYLYFSQEVDPNQDINKIISTSLGVDLTDKVYIYGSTIHITNLPVEALDKYSINIKGKLRDIYGQTIIKGDETIYVEVPEASAYVRFPDKAYGSSRRARVGYLESQFNPALIIQHQNLDKLSYMVTPINTIMEYNNELELKDVDLKNARKNNANFEYIDISDLVNTMGNGSVLFKAKATYRGYENREHEVEDNLLVQTTDIGITVRFGYNMILVWSNSLANGAPIIGAKVSLFDRDKIYKSSVVSDKNGLAIFKLSPGEFAKSYFSYNAQSFWVSVTGDNDSATLEVFDNLAPWRYGLYGKDVESAEDAIQRVLLFSDRKLYKPGEELSFRSIHWLQQLGEFTPYAGSYSIELSSGGYKSKTLYTLSGITTPSGGGFGTFKLPDVIAPGSYYLTYEAMGKKHSTEVEIANFRRLNFYVSSRVPERTYYYKDTLSSSVKAGYLAGGAMPGSEYSYYWTRQISQFRPKGSRWSSWIFGVDRYSGETTLDSGSGKLSNSGEVQIKAVAKGHEDSSATYQYILETTVTDIDNQQVSATSSFIVHPSSFYIGAKLGDEEYPTSFIKAKDEATLHFSLVFPNGDNYLEPADVELELYKVSWKSTNQQGVYDRINVSYRKSEELIKTLKTKSDGKGYGEFKLTPEKSGSYFVKIKSRDNDGRYVETELNFYSYGGGWSYWGGDSSTITLLPNKDLYFPGDKAEIMVQSPLAQGKYLLTVEREGIISESIIELGPDDSMLEIPIDESWIPRVYVALTSFTNRVEVPDSYFTPDLGKPKNLFGVTALNISSISRTLDIEVASTLDSYRPGDDAEVYIKVTKGGEPVSNAELIYMAVDRGVVDLVNYHVPNPLLYFYNPHNFPLYTSGDDLRNYLMDPVSYDISNLQGGDGEKKMDERVDFNPLAAFEPNIRTDANGIAKVSFKLPDTLTTYRTTVIALDSNKVGYNEDEILVQNPINVRTAFPRKLRLRDTGVGSVILQNNTISPVDATLSIESSGVDFPGDAEKIVTIPGNSLYKVDYLMEPKLEGTNEIVVTIESKVLNEKLKTNLVVVRPLIKETFATTGIVEGGLAIEGILIPENIMDGYGSYNISLYASKFGLAKAPVNNLRNKKLNLIDKIYNYMPEAVLGEDLQSLGIEYSPEGLVEVLSILKNRQSSLGWIKYWNNQSKPNLYLDIVSLMFVINAEKRAVLLPLGLKELLIGSVMDGVKNLENFGDTAAFATYILKDGGADVSLFSKKLLENRDGLGITGLGYLSSTLIDSGKKKDGDGVYSLAKKYVRPGTRSVDINETYGSRWYFDSEIRQISSLILSGLKSVENSQMISKYIFTLSDRLNSGLWRSQSDYLWSLLAIKMIAQMDKVDSLDMNVALLIDDQIIKQKGINKLSDSTLDVKLPITETPLVDLERNKPYALRVEKEGSGNIYYSAEFNYALPTEIANPRDEGISLYLAYETLEGEVVNPKDIVIGTTYRVRSVISSNRERSYLTLDIPVPSGIEIIDPSFATSSSYKNRGGVNSETWSREGAYGDETEFIAEGYMGSWWFWKNEPDQEIYDNHLTYLWETFYEGKREITFLVRATNRGIYPTPPATATLQFEPEVFGRTAGELFVIK